MKLLAILLLSLCQESPFHLPQTDTTPTPAPPVEPRPVTSLPEDHFFVVESDVAAFILHSPDGLLSVTEDSGPIKLRGKFAGGSGKVETKTFAKPFVYTIEGVKSGTCELILIPTNCTDSGQIKRLVLSVNGAKPPPDDDKKPEPGPTPTPTIETVHLDIVEDSLNRTVAAATTLNALVGWNEFHDAGNTMRIRDKANQTAAIKADIGDTPLPAMIVRDKATKKPIRVMQLPESFDLLKRVLSELGVK